MIYQQEREKQSQLLLPSQTDILFNKKKSKQKYKGGRKITFKIKKKI